MEAMQAVLTLKLRPLSLDRVEVSAYVCTPEGEPIETLPTAVVLPGCLWTFGPLYGVLALPPGEGQVKLAFLAQVGEMTCDVEQNLPKQFPTSLVPEEGSTDGA